MTMTSFGCVGRPAAVRAAISAAGICLAALVAACTSVPASPGGPAPAVAATASTPALTAAQIAALLADPGRSDADRRIDVRRKPAEVLAFIGVRPGMTALDLSSGGGYTTELLARAVGPTGHVFGQSPPPRAAAPVAMAPASASASASVPVPVPVPVPVSVPVRRTSAMALAERSQRSGLANISAVVQPFEFPSPAPVAIGAVDVVTIMFDYHDLGALGVDRAKMNAAVFLALKPGGVYVIADHAGRPGTGISESATLHRIEESFLRKEVEAAGFRLAAAGDFLRNPADPRDREDPLPPMPKDEFILKFVRP